MSAKGNKHRAPHSQPLSLPSQGIGLRILHPLSFWDFLLCFPSPVLLYTGQKQRGDLVCQ